MGCMSHFCFRVLTGLLLTANALRAVPGDVDPTFHADLPAGLRFAYDLQPDGKIVIVNDTLPQQLIRLNSDGSRDPSFVPDLVGVQQIFNVRCTLSTNVLVACAF